MKGRSGQNRRIITAFDFTAGDIVADKYIVLGRLGRGWEGEVYLVSERATGIKRTAKFFLPQGRRARGLLYARRYSTALKPRTRMCWLWVSAPRLRWRW